MDLNSNNPGLCKAWQYCVKPLNTTTYGNTPIVLPCSQTSKKVNSGIFHGLEFLLRNWKKKFGLHFLNKAIAAQYLPSKTYLLAWILVFN